MSSLTNKQTKYIEALCGAIITSADANHIIYAVGDKRYNILNIDTGKEKEVEIKSDEKFIGFKSIKRTSMSDTIAVVTHKGTALINIHKDDQKVDLKPFHNDHCIIPSYNSIITWCTNGLKYSNIETGEIRGKYSSYGAIWSVDKLRYGGFIIGLSDGSIEKWNGHDTDSIKSHKIYEYDYDNVFATTVTDKNYFCSGRTRSYIIKMFDIDKFNLIREFDGHSEKIETLEVRKNMLLSFSENELMIWDINTGERLYTAPKQKYKIIHATLSIDDKLIIISEKPSSSSHNNYNVDSWDIDQSC